MIDYKVNISGKEMCLYLQSSSAESNVKHIYSKKLKGKSS